MARTARCVGSTILTGSLGAPTPYSDAAKAFLRLQRLEIPEGALANWQAAADKEIAFLEGLRDKLSKQAK